MSKVYLSFLGTNCYLDCIYHYNNRYMPLARFVQEATLELFCSEWQETDRIMIFTTALALKKNWLDGGQGDNRKGLGRCIQDLNLRAKIERIDIPDGHDERQIWQIFEAVLNRLSPGDEIVFDITHAFRSIPMLAVVVLNYAKVLKGIRLGGIYYGAFESLGPIQLVKKKAPEDRKAPILNLTAFDRLLDWSLAVDRFLGAGDAKGVSSLAADAVAPILKDTKGQDDAAAAIKGIANALNRYTTILSTCRGPEISRAVAYLRQEFQKSRQVDLIKPLSSLFDHIEEQIRQFNGHAVKDGIQAVRWCLEHNLIQQGFTILFETLISYYVDCIGEDHLDEEIRKTASSALQIFMKREHEDKLYGDAASHRHIARMVIEQCQKTPEIATLVDRLRKVRNDINHAGYKKDALRGKDFAGKLEQMIKDAESYLI
jgi:CRISPR-associated Csx2 family protein